MTLVSDTHDRRGEGRRDTDHKIEDCPHNPTFENVNATLKRLEDHSARTTLALEQIAMQGAMVINHEKRLDKGEKDTGEAFSKIRHLDDRVRVVELRHAEDKGSDKVIDEQQKFWTEIKLRLLPWYMAAIMFLLWLLDKFNVIQKLGKLYKEMSG